MRADLEPLRQGILENIDGSQRNAIHATLPSAFPFGVFLHVDTNMCGTDKENGGDIFPLEHGHSVGKIIEMAVVEGQVEVLAINSPFPLDHLKASARINERSDLLEGLDNGPKVFYLIIKHVMTKHRAKETLFPRLCPLNQSQRGNHRRSRKSTDL